MRLFAYLGRRLALLSGVCGLMACWTGAAYAQPEIVPAEHPVYAFLHHQRVRGVLPEYRHEVLPLGRGQVMRLLDSLQTRASALDPTAQRWLGLYRRELFEPAEVIETVFGSSGVRLPLGRDTEKFIYYYRDAQWRFASELRGLPQLRFASDSTEGLRGGSMAGVLTLQGNYRGLAGFYTSIFNGEQVAGDALVLGRDPTLAPLYYTQVQPLAEQFDRATASFRVASRRFSAEIAQARLLVGAAFGESLLLTATPDYYPFVRLGVETRVVQYQFVHAALGDGARMVPSSGGGSPVRVGGVERYLAMHRVSVQPWRWASLAFTEMIVYGRRGPELAYLNPVNPFVTAEHALWDRDNPLFALEAVVRPLPRLELHATWLVDDADFSRLGQGSYNNKWGVQVGAGVAATSSALVWAEYTRLDPFVYTHRFELDGSFYNSLLHNDFPLGHPLGPNADQIEGGLALRLPGRFRARLQARYARRGENFVDADGTFVNVGGDVLDGDQPPFSELSKRFLRGEVSRGPGGTAELAWEPLRDVLDFRLYADVQTWDGDAPDTFFLRLEWLMGL